MKTCETESKALFSHKWDLAMILCFSSILAYSVAFSKSLKFLSQFKKNSSVIDCNLKYMLFNSLTSSIFCSFAVVASRQSGVVTSRKNTAKQLFDEHWKTIPVNSRVLILTSSFQKFGNLDACQIKVLNPRDGKWIHLPMTEHTQQFAKIIHLL